MHLNELPNFTARPGTDEPHHYGQVNTPFTKEEWKRGYAAVRRTRRDYTLTFFVAALEPWAWRSGIPA